MRFQAVGGLNFSQIELACPLSRRRSPVALLPGSHGVGEGRPLGNFSQPFFLKNPARNHVPAAPGASHRAPAPVSKPFVSQMPACAGMFAG